MELRGLLHVVTLFALLLAGSARAASYRFVVLADSATAIVRPADDKAPSIDEEGSVAFVAALSGGGGSRLFVASQPGADDLADFAEIAPLGLAPGTEQVGTFTAGKLAYLDYLAASSTESLILRAEEGGGPPLPIRIVSGAAAQDAPAMNALGQVALLESSGQVVVTDGEDTELVAALGAVFLDGTEIDNLLRPAPDIDDTGRVAYFASIFSAEDPICDDRILLSGTNPPLQIATGGVLRDDCSFRGADSTPIAANDTGSAAFSGYFLTPGGLVGAAFVDGDVVWEQRIEGFPETGFSPVDALALNDTGTMAFLLAFSGAVGRALYVGPDPVADRVIGRGDALCGGTVSELRFHRFGLNDAGELALTVLLTNSRRLVVRAEPTAIEPGACITEVVPEPGAGSVIAGATLAALAWRRSRSDR